MLVVSEVISRYAYGTGIAIRKIVGAMTAAGFAGARQEADRLEDAGSNRYTPIVGWKPA